MTYELFECPQCGRTHDEPAEATYALLVLCLDCAMEIELAAQRVVPQAAPRAA